VLFDLFRTLTSAEGTNPDHPPEAHVMLGFDCEPQLSAWHAAWAATADDRALGRIATPRDVLAIPARMVEPTLPDALLDAAVAVRQRRFDRALLCVEPDVLDALSTLRRAGVRLALVSNADRMDVHAWPNSPLVDFFEAVVFSCDVAACKPDPAIYLAACRALAVRAEGCLFVGDGGGDELAGAAALGMVPVQLTAILDRYFPQLVEPQGVYAQHRIAHLSELSACCAERDELPTL